MTNGRLTRLLAAAIVAGAPLAAGAPVAAETLTPRAAPQKPSLSTLEQVRSSGQVVVKFAEGSRARIRDGRVSGLDTAEAAALEAALGEFGLGAADLTRLHEDVPEATLEAQRSTAERKRGQALADLNLYYMLSAPAGTTPAKVAARLNALPFVELAEPQPAPVAPPAATPNFVPEQGYRTLKTGVGTLDPKQHPGGDGRGVTVTDVEYSWLLDHEDLRIPRSAIVKGIGTPVDPFNDTNHGTAVLGELVAIPNSFGVTGLVPKASIRVAATNTTRGFSVARAITRAATILDAGDVILIEQQTPVCGGACGSDQVGCGPVEWNQPEFDSIETATGLGIVVVEAAGNGNVDLDKSACLGRFNRATRDSGAVIVGAGAPGTRRRLSFSSYGTRVDVQGWGSGVWSTGYGDAFDPGTPRRAYTATFGGTSGASPIVTGVAAAVQGALARSGRRFATPTEIRTALVRTGLAQRGGQHIGPLPQTLKALNFLKRTITSASAPALAAAE